MDTVSDTVDRAAKLTVQLLACALLEALGPEVFDVGARLAGTATMLGVLPGARIGVFTTKPERPRFVQADATQCDTAPVNLVVNARAAMAGEGTLAVALAYPRSVAMRARRARSWPSP